MRPDEFVIKAMASFSDDPMYRVSDLVDQKISLPDTHFHIFDKNWCGTQLFFD